MDKDKKKSVALMILEKQPKAAAEEGSEDPDVTKQEILMEEFAAALDSGDYKAAAEALQSFYMVCSNDME